MLRKSLELSIKDFYCVSVRTEMNLIAFSGSQNCVNTQYATLSGAMDIKTDGGLMKGQKYCRMLALEHSAILLTCIKQ